MREHLEIPARHFARLRNAGRLAHRLGTTLAVAALLAGAAARVAARVEGVRLALELAHAAARSPDPGPLFLKVLSRRMPAAGDACADLRPGGDPHVMYLTVLACQAEGQGGWDVDQLRALAAAGFRPAYSSAMLILTLARQGEIKEAGTAWQRCPAEECEALLVRARTMEACSTAALLDNGSRSAASCLGGLLRRDGKFDEAMAQFDRALSAQPVRSRDNPLPATAELPPSSADILYQMGEIELARGNLLKAWRFTLKSLESEPDHYWAVFQKAMLLAGEGKRQAAIAELERLLERYPAHGAAMLNLGLLHESAGNLGAAEHWYIEARKVLPNKALADTQLRRLKAAGTMRQ